MDLGSARVFADASGIILPHSHYWSFSNLTFGFKRFHPKPPARSLTIGTTVSTVRTNKIPPCVKPEHSLNDPQSALSAWFPQMSMLLSIFIHFLALGQILVRGETNIGFFQPCALWNPVRPSSKAAGQWPSSPGIGTGHCRLCFKATEPFWQSYFVQQSILSQAEQFFHETVARRIGKYQRRTQYCKVWGHDQEFSNLIPKQLKQDT